MTLAATRRLCKKHSGPSNGDACDLDKKQFTEGHGGCPCGRYRFWRFAPPTPIEILAKAGEVLAKIGGAVAMGIGLLAALFIHPDVTYEDNYLEGKPSKKSKKARPDYEQAVAVYENTIDL